MVNKSDILDLMPERSFVRWMASQGRDVYLLDWGEAKSDLGQSSIQHLIQQKIIPSIGHIKTRHSACHLLGYCLGGTVVAAVSSLMSNLMQSVVFLATPWDFHAGDPTMRQLVSLASPSGQWMMGHYGYLPMRWIQSIFAQLDPQLTLEKFASFAAIKEGDEKANVFVAVEDWINDGVDIPLSIAHTCIDDFYGKNAPAGGGWLVEGQKIRAEDIVSPSYVVLALRDKLVPPESSRALYAQLPKADYLEVQTGHIGLIAGSKAIQTVWQPISDWLARHD